jgi:hypothetical protein
MELLEKYSRCDISFHFEIVLIVDTMKGLYEGKKVAIKVLKAISHESCKEFKKEFHIMR